MVSRPTSSRKPSWMAPAQVPPCSPWAVCACCRPWLPLRLQDKIHRGRACLLLVFKVAGESCSKLQVTAFWDKWTKRGPAGGTRRLDPKERSQLRENVPPQLCTPETVTVASHWSQEPRCPGQGGGQNQSRLGSPPFLGLSSSSAEWDSKCQPSGWREDEVGQPTGHPPRAHCGRGLQLGGVEPESPVSPNETSVGPLGNFPEYSSHTHTHTRMHRFLATLELLGTIPQGLAGEQGVLGQPVPWHWLLVSPHP